MSLSLVSTSVMSLNMWLRRRGEIAWQKEITHQLHKSWFADMKFYRQSLRPDGGIADPG